MPDIRSAAFRPAPRLRGLPFALALATAVSLASAEDAIKATRSDLAVSYLRFERAFVDRGVSDADAPRFNEGFDAATLQFFRGRFAEAIQGIDALAGELLAGGPAPAELAIAMSLRARVEPRVVVPGGPAPKVVLESLYSPAPPSKGDTTLRLTLRSETAKIEMDGRPRPTGGPVENFRSIELDLPKDLAPGAYRVSAAWGDAGAAEIELARFSVAPVPPSAARAGFEERLAKIADPALATPLAICAARAALLSDEPSEKNSAQFLAEPVSLAASLEGEVAALEAGRDPYVRRPGDYWRVLGPGRPAIPLRVFAPDAATGDSPAPVVVALHGAGGDENMFMDGYGGGMLKKIAAEKGFLLATPATSLFAAGAGNLSVLIESLAAHYPIDRSRVYMIGHSMGGGATAGFADSSADSLAAAVCIAGLKPLTASRIPPLLAYAGRLDPVVPMARLEPPAEAAKAAGLPLDFRVVEGYGHTLLVPKVLPEAIDWLLARRLEAR